MDALAQWKVKKQSFDMYVSDFETLTEDSEDFQAQGHTDVFRWGYRKLQDLPEQYLDRTIGMTIEEWYDSVFATPRNKKIWFHNVKFDGTFIERYLINHTNLKYLNSMDDYHQKGSFPDNAFQIFRNGKKLFRLTINRAIKFNGKTRRVKITLQCSYNLLNASIKSIGNDYNMNKYQEEGQDTREWYNSGGFNMEKSLEDRWVKYLNSDLDIQARALYDFFESFKEDENAYNRDGKGNKVMLDPTKLLTIAGTITKMWENYIFRKRNDTDYEWDIISANKGRVTREQHIESRNYYSGGFTQFNPEYMVSQKELGYTSVADANEELAVSIDINSAYPYSATQDLPYGELSDTPFEESPLYRNIQFVNAKIKFANIKPQYKQLVNMKNWNREDGILEQNRYMEYMTDFEMFVSSWEWEWFIKHYEMEVESICYRYSKASDFAKDFIQPYYDRKSSAKAEGRKAEEGRMKLLLNAFYGSLAKRMEYNTAIAVDEEAWVFLSKQKKGEYKITIGEKDYIYMMSSLLKIGKWRYIEVLEVKRHKKYSAPPVLMAAVITSRTRVQLWNTIEKVGFKFFIYSDTDSIFFSCGAKRIEKSGISIHKFNLGSYGFDKSYDRITIGAAKRYMVENTRDNKTDVGFAGVDSKQLSYTDIRDLLVNGGIIEHAGLVLKTDSHGAYLSQRSKEIKVGRL